MAGSLNELAVLVGYKCNFKCAHCCNGHNRSEGLSSDEKRKVISTINSCNPRSILFVGGETVLYLDTVNEILSAMPRLSGSRIKVTTNGYFARTVPAATAVLRSFRKVDEVQLSYDRFHAEFLPIENIRNLYLACKALGKKFAVIYTVDSPMEVVGLKKLWGMGEFKVFVNKAVAVGEAARNGIEYPFPSFNRNVLRRACPARHKMVYVCGRGFSSCCSNLTFETALPTTHDTVLKHKKSRLHRLISTYTLGQLLKMSGLPDRDLPPRFSHECVLCEHIFTKGRLAL